MHFVLKQKYSEPSLLQAYSPAAREAETRGSHNKYKSYLDYRVSSSVTSLDNLNKDFSQNKKEDWDIVAHWCDPHLSM